MSGAISVRVGQAADAETIARLHADSWRAAYRGMYSDAYLDSDVVEDRLRVWRQRFDPPAEHQLVLIAHEGEAALGFVCAYGDDDGRWGTLVDNLHVLAEHQRRGIGRRLLASSAVWSRDRYPESPLHLWVLDGNVKARRFYESIGGRAEDSRMAEPPGGGELLCWRYVWTSLAPLLGGAES